MKQKFVFLICALFLCAATGFAKIVKITPEVIRVPWQGGTYTVKIEFDGPTNWTTKTFDFWYYSRCFDEYIISDLDIEEG